MQLYNILKNCSTKYEKMLRRSGKINEVEEMKGDKPDIVENEISFFQTIEYVLNNVVPELVGKIEEQAQTTDKKDMKPEEVSKIKQRSQFKTVLNDVVNNLSIEKPLNEIKKPSPQKQ